MIHIVALLAGELCQASIHSFKQVTFFYCIEIYLFYLSIIGIQCCISFQCTTMWISSLYTCISSLFNLPPKLPPLPRFCRSLKNTKLSKWSLILLLSRIFSWFPVAHLFYVLSNINLFCIFFLTCFLFSTFFSFFGLKDVFYSDFRTAKNSHLD